MSVKQGSLEIDRMDIHLARPIDWVWKGRLVKSSLNLIVGNEGVGKGTLVAWILAKLTKGKLQGNLWEQPCNVAVIGNEDSFHHVWGPRLWSAGCDAKRVARIRRLDLNQVEIGVDLSELAGILQSRKIKVLYFDQFLDNLGADADHYNSKQVRAALTPLQTVANELEVTVIATLHPNKRAENFRQLVQGSSAFNAVSRSSLLVADHPDDEAKRVLLTGKSNYGVRGKAVEFKILEDHIRPNGRLLTTTKCVSFAASDLRIEDLLRPRDKGEYREGSRKSKIEELIRDFLADHEWHESKDVLAMCSGWGYADSTVRLVAKNMGVKRRRMTFQGPVFWSL